MKLATCACGAQWEVKKLLPHHSCKDCQDKRRAGWQKSHPDRVKAKNIRWRERHPERARECENAWRRANPEKKRRINRRAYRRYAKKQKLLNKELIASLPCLDCGLSHSAERRQAVIRRMLPATSEDIRESWPCFWQGIAGAARLNRDLRAMGATSRDWVWQLRREAA